MASHLSLVLLPFFLYFAATAIVVSASNGAHQLVMEEEELLGLFEVLGSLLDDPNWSQVHPLPCTETPWPGVQCEISDYDNDGKSSIFHVTKIHIGPDILDPPCKTNATLSKSLLKLKYLKTLSLFNCFITSPFSLSPALFGAFSALEHLSLVSNPALVGLIPQTLTGVASLRVLSLSQNNLHGKIPNGFGGLVNLEQLDFSYNNLSGEIHEEIGGLMHLSILDLSSNRFVGVVPYTIGHLEYLQKIDLSNNRLVSRVPQQLGNLKRLVLLDLSHNLLTGPLPQTLSGLLRLEYLIIENCPINTGMPLFIGTLNKLKTLSFSSCGLTGPIPNYFSSLKNLTSLSLDNNALEGTVPSNIGSLLHLNQLNLSQNKLSGELVFQEEFIKRLGNRLDVRGNYGLCTKMMIASCLGTKRCNNQSWGDEEPDGIQRVMPPNWYHENMSSNAPRVHQMFIQPVFVFWFLRFLL